MPVAPIVEPPQPQSMQPSPHRTNAHASRPERAPPSRPFHVKPSSFGRVGRTTPARSGRAASTVGHGRNLGSSESRPCGGKAVPAVDALTRTFPGSRDQEGSSVARSPTKMFYVERPASTRGAVPRPIALWQPRRRLSASSPRRLYGRMRSGSRPTAHGPRPTGVIPQVDPPTVTPHEIPVARAVRHRGARVVSRETAPQDPSAGGGAPDKALLAAAPPPGCPRIRSHAHQHPSNGRSAERCRSAHARNCCCSSATRARHGIRLRPHGGEMHDAPDATWGQSPVHLPPRCTSACTAPCRTRLPAPTSEHPAPRHRGTPAPCGSSRTDGAPEPYSPDDEGAASPSARRPFATLSRSGRQHHNVSLRFHAS